MYQNYSIQEWAQIISSSEASGLPRSEWLKLNGITKDRYYYWKKRVNNWYAANSAYAENVSADCSETSTSLVEVPVAATRTTNAANAATIHIGNLYIELNNNASAELIENIGRMIHNAL